MSDAVNQTPRMRLRAASLMLVSALAAPEASFAEDQVAQSKPEQPVEAKAVTLDTIRVEGQRVDVPASVGSKFDLPLERLPQSAQLIDAQAIAETGARSIGDVLRTVPSANTGNSRVARYQSFSLKIRGFLADQMRNGIRQRYFEDVDASALSNIERIEVLKGPSGVLYGQSAVGGLINIVTRQPQPEFAASGAATFGSYDQKLLSADLTGTLSADHKLTARLTGEIERSGTFVDFQDLDRENLGLTLAWSPSTSVSAHLVTEWHNRQTLNNPGLPVFGTVLDNGVGEIPIERFLGEPEFSALGSYAPLLQAWVDFKLSENWTLTPRAQYSGFTSRILQVRVAAPSDPVTITRTGRYGREDDRYSIYQLDLQGRFATGPLRHQLLLGVEHDVERATFVQENLSNLTPVNVFDPDYSYDEVSPARVFAFDSDGDLDGDAVYLQDLIALTPQLELLAGLRHSKLDSTSVFNASVDKLKVDNTSWQIGATFRFDERWSMYGGYNTGFDTENTLGSRRQNGDPLDPEESEQTELGLRYGDGPLRASAALFQIRRKNVATTDEANPDFQIQTGEVEVQGIELEGEWQLRPGLNLRGGYAYLDSEIVESGDGDEGNRLGDTPENQFNLSGRWSVAGTPFELRAVLNYVGSRSLTNSGLIAVPDGDPDTADVRVKATLPDYVTTDFAIGYTLGKLGVELFLSNAFDERYFTANGGSSTSVYPGDPQQLSLRASYRY